MVGLKVSFLHKPTAKVKQVLVQEACRFTEAYSIGFLMLEIV